MTPDSTRPDQERQVSPHAQEIEYALILQRMINTVKDNPTQMRLTIYEFARARLKIDTSIIEEGERQRLAAALETAIHGVEDFTIRREERLPPPNPQAQIAPLASPTVPAAAAPASALLARHRTVTPAPEDILAPERVYPRPHIDLIGEARTRALVSMLARFCIGMLLFGIVASLAYYNQRLPLLRDNLSHFLTSNATQPVAAVAPATTPPASAIPDLKPAVAAPNAPPFPVPSDYGIYALSDDTLSELFALPERVPDKRIAVSTPVDQPSRTTLPDGKARFIVFRRDLVGNAPDRIEIRAVARVARAISFDARGRPTISPVSDAWNNRNVS